eukprot:SAG31_NODE_31663_length_365_cov_1.191729_1_plen_46_part_01
MLHPLAVACIDGQRILVQVARNAASFLLAAVGCKTSHLAGHFVNVF